MLGPTFSESWPQLSPIRTIRESLQLSRIREFANSWIHESFTTFANSRIHDFTNYTNSPNSWIRETAKLTFLAVPAKKVSCFAIRAQTFLQKSSAARRFRSVSRTSAASFANRAPRSHDRSAPVYLHQYARLFSCGAAHLLRSQVAVIEFDVSNCGFDPLAATKNFLLRARKLATPNFRKVFCNKKIFSTPQKFFLRSQKTFSEKFLVSKNFLRKFLARKIISSPEEIFLLLQKFFLQLKKTFSEKFSDITHITRTCTRTSVGWFLFAHTAVCRKVSVLCEENFFFTAIHRSQSRSDPVILLLRAAARNKEFLYVNCGLNDG